MKKRRMFLTLLPFLALILSIGCAHCPPPLQSPEESLQKRIEGLMQAKIDGKWDVVYTFYDASFRNAVAIENFAQKTKNITFKAFRIEKIKILSSRKEARVKVAIDISFQGFDFKDAPKSQHWIKEKGKWFLKVKPLSDNPFKNTVKEVR